MELPFYDAVTMWRRLRPRDAVAALEAALRDGVEPADAAPRSILPAGSGELLLMPGEAPGAIGVKIATVAPGNAALGLPLIQGIYVLLDQHSLAPVALLDGAALTAMRTPAMSLLALKGRLLATREPLEIVVAGTGVQAVRHVAAALDVVAGIRPVTSVTYLARSRRPAPVVPGAAGVASSVALLGSREACRAIGSAGLVVCATSSPVPLFDGALVGSDAAVAAVGSHDPERHELDEHLMGRSRVLVEDVATALRECGDVVRAIRAGTLVADDLVPVRTAVRRPGTCPDGRPVVWKSSGMGWEDAAVARAIVSAR